MQVGDTAPDFTLTDQRGEPFTLSSLREAKNVVIFFYPKDGTPICTKEACSFRDAYADFAGVDAEVIGISADGTAAHERFAGEHDLPYRVLSDPDHAVAKKYGAMMMLGLMADRITFVIDKAGIVRHVTQARFSAGKHVEAAKRALASM